MIEQQYKCSNCTIVVPKSELFFMFFNREHVYLKKCPNCLDAKGLEKVVEGNYKSPRDKAIEQWNVECLQWRGKVLTGKFGHYCDQMDGLPVDETCYEWDNCLCFKKEDKDY